MISNGSDGSANDDPAGASPVDHGPAGNGPAGNGSAGAGSVQAAFLHTLRRGLSGLPSAEVEDIVADYASHFAESAALGRAERDVAAALGDPARIAREMRAELGLRRFEDHWSLGNMVRAGAALVAVALVDLLFLLPLFVVAIAIVLVVAAVLVLVGAIGVKIAFAALFLHGSATLVTVVARLLIGLGLLGLFLGGGALLLLGLGAGVRFAGRLARLRFRLARPEGDDRS